MRDEWVRNARLLRVLDGDTIQVEVDLGFSVRIVRVLRLIGVNTPEMHGATMIDALAARHAVENWCMGHRLTIRTMIQKTSTDPRQSFERVLADVWRIMPDGRAESLAEFLISDGYGVQA